MPVLRGHDVHGCGTAPSTNPTTCPSFVERYLSRWILTLTFLLGRLGRLTDSMTTMCRGRHHARRDSSAGLPRAPEHTLGPATSPVRRADLRWSHGHLSRLESAGLIERRLTRPTARQARPAVRRRPSTPRHRDHRLTDATAAAVPTSTTTSAPMCVTSLSPSNEPVCRRRPVSSPTRSAPTDHHPRPDPLSGHFAHGRHAVRQTPRRSQPQALRDGSSSTGPRAARRRSVHRAAHCPATVFGDAEPPQPQTPVEDLIVCVR